MKVTRLALRDFRCYHVAEVTLAERTTVVTGGNGQGKTSLLEALRYASTARSLRAVPDEALVRQGADAAYIRLAAEVDCRQRQVELEVRATGRNRVRVDGRQVARARELAGVVPTTVFSPDDLTIVKGPPGGRRDVLDDLLVALAPRYVAASADFARTLRQRNALLRRGMGGEHAESTLAVFDEQLVRSGGELTRGRIGLCERLAPLIAAAYRALADDPDATVTATYEASWAATGADHDASPPVRDDVDTRLRAALDARRREEIERQTTMVGPHRDEWRLRVGALDGRTHASQGEQRTLALALRLAGHRLLTEVSGTTPVLLLDDVFSELDERRAGVLVASLPPGQVVLTTAGTVPEELVPELRLRVVAGMIEDAT